MERLYYLKIFRNPSSLHHALWMYTCIKTLNFHIWIWKKDLTLLQDTDILLSSLRFLENYYAKGNLSATKDLRVHGLLLDFPGGACCKESPANVGEVGSVSGSGRCPGGGNDNPLQYFCPENPVARGGWQATIHKVSKTWTWLTDWAHTHTFWFLPSVLIYIYIVSHNIYMVCFMIFSPWESCYFLFWIAYEFF